MNESILFNQNFEFDHSFNIFHSGEKSLSSKAKSMKFALQHNKVVDGNLTT